MAVPADKAWYGRQLDRLHRDAPTDQKTIPEDALRHLPVEYLAEVLDETFKNYETRASGFAERCLVEGNMDTYLAFIKAHQNILERFDMPAPNYYGDLATIIGTYFIRKKEIQLGIMETTIRREVRAAPKMPDSPLSESPAPLSISSWINKVETNTIEPTYHAIPKPPPHTPEDSSPQESLDTAPDPTTNTPEDSFSVAPMKFNRQLSEQTPSASPLRQRHPRKVNSESVNQSPPKPSGRGSTKKLGRGRKATNKGPTIVADAETNTHKQPRGTKRLRAGDAVAASEDAHVAQKRRKIAKPATRSKR
ncbi:hypothetical protein N431DRAFT_440057 [Stipitochalara longipes BDJ]|nr:hypothetical protein N431DRAFT_440057 [Stipitochalara longipes BDJ]